MKIEKIQQNLLPCSRAPENSSISTDIQYNILHKALLKGREQAGASGSKKTLLPLAPAVSGLKINYVSSGSRFPGAMTVFKQNTIFLGYEY